MDRFKSIKHQNNHPEEHPILHFDYLKITCDKGKKVLYKEERMHIWSIKDQYAVS